ncbi:MAG: ATP-binding protein [Planctomycetota bacterium]
MTEVKSRKNTDDLFDRLFSSETSAVFTNSEDAIIALDLEDQIRFWNRGAEALFGYVADEVLGQPYEILVPKRKRYREEAVRIQRALAETDEVRGLQTERLNKDGDGVPVLLSQTVLRDAKGHVFGASVILKDITERVLLEEKLRHSEKLGAIGKMASHIVHEIRNPLSSILLNVDLLGDEVAEYESNRKLNVSEVRDLLRCISQELTVLKQVTDEYLHFARLPRNVPEPTDLNVTLEELVRFLKREFFTLNVNLETSLDTSLGVCLIDPQKVRQALLNVLKNAIEAMPQGGTLSISTRPYRSSWMRIEISDTGLGIPEENLEEIFTPFYSTKKGGTGLGLSYARGVIADADGRTRVKSTEGKGTTFLIDLPLMKKKA